MLHRPVLGAAVALALLVLPAAPAAAGTPSTVSVRVEGLTDTLVPRTTVSTTTTPVVKDGNPAHACDGTTAAGALDRATGGEWSGQWSDSFQYSVDVVRGESHPFFGDPVYWGIFRNGEPTSTGLCSTDLQTGDALLLAPVPEDGSPVGLLDVQAPATVRPGASYEVHVRRTVTTYDASFNPSTTSGAAAGAVVGGVRTDTAGVAHFVAGGAGTIALRAVRDGDVRSATEQVCVFAAQDGTCGTPDRTAPRSRIASIREQQRFSRARPPRTLAGTVEPDVSGLRKVTLRLTRTDGPRCTTLDGHLERFVQTKHCGAAYGRWFSVGDRDQWSYLLPFRLGRGRYVLDVRATDKAGNIEYARQRTRNRVVFHVR